jgi:hypothetical protein
VDCEPVQSGALHPSSLPQEASPVRQGYVDLGRQGTRRLSQQQTLEDPSTIFFMFLGPHVGAQCLCACPPSAIKGEACGISHTRNLRLASSYKLSSNTSHNGVGYYAPAARTTLNPCVFLSSSPSLQRSSETPKPLLISALRAGALRHPAGDLLSDKILSKGNDIRNNHGSQVDHWISWEGLSTTLVRWDTTTWSRQAFEA